MPSHVKALVALNIFIAVTGLVWGIQSAQVGDWLNTVVCWAVAVYSTYSLVQWYRAARR